MDTVANHLNSHQLKQEKVEKYQKIMDEELRRKDTILRKKPRFMIRADSWTRADTIKMKSLTERVSANDEITNAGIRQAQRKAAMRSHDNEQ